MATAISFVSESGDHYLSLFDKGESPEEMITSMREEANDEWSYLYIQNVTSTELSKTEIQKFTDMISKDIDASEQED